MKICSTRNPESNELVQVQRSPNTSIENVVIMPEIDFITQEIACNLMDFSFSSAEQSNFCRVTALRDLQKTPSENMNTSNDILGDSGTKSKENKRKSDNALLNDLVDFYCPTCKKKCKNPEYFVRGDLRCSKCFTRQKFSCVHCNSLFSLLKGIRTHLEITCALVFETDY